MPKEAIKPDDATRKLLIAGMVDSVMEQLLVFRAQVGDFRTLLYAGRDRLDPALGQRSMQFMTEEVMPRLDAAIGAA